RTGFSSSAPLLTLITARSSGANTPTSLAFSGWLSTETRTWKVLTVPTTWAFVTMSPCWSKTTPDPVVLPAVISTTEGSASVIAASYSRWIGALYPGRPLAPEAHAATATVSRPALSVPRATRTRASLMRPPTDDISHTPPQQETPLS